MSKKSAYACYTRRKENGVCVICGGEKETDRNRCNSCSKKQNLISKNHRINNLKRYKENNKRLKKQYISEGRCTNCSRPMIYSGNRMRCITCASKFWEGYRWS